MRTCDRMCPRMNTEAVKPEAIRKAHGISEQELADGTWATLSSLDH